jgi:hypothetical protein
MENHADAIDAEYAAVIAARFLQREGCDCENPGPDCPQLSAGHFEYLTGDDSVVYEFPLVNNPDTLLFPVLAHFRRCWSFVQPEIRSE